MLRPPPPPTLLDRVAELTAGNAAFCLATVVRTVSVTAAKAGAKAVILSDGTIVDGWIGGGCARGAVLRAAREALADGKPRLVSLMPGDLLTDLGVAAGVERDGVHFARNRCPSQGTMDVFVEPVLPRPTLVVFGASPVAVALSDLAPRFGYCVIVGLEPGPSDRDDAFIVVSTQGAGDEAALKAALSRASRYVAFVGSSRKMAALREALVADGVPAALVDQVNAPAGLDLGAITPDEIALSILAEVLAIRRKGQREPAREVRS